MCRCQEIATVMHELGIGLALAKLVDPDAVPDRLYGDFVETFYALASAERAPRRRSRR